MTSRTDTRFSVAVDADRMIPHAESPDRATGLPGTAGLAEDGGPATSWGRPCSCWPRCWGRTWKPARTACCASPGKVAPDRVISTVDPQARHGHKTNHRGFDGYEGHIAIDPDSEVITATALTRGNIRDAEPAPARTQQRARPTWCRHDSAGHPPRPGPPAAFHDPLPHSST